MKRLFICSVAPLVIGFGSLLFCEQAFASSEWTVSVKDKFTFESDASRIPGEIEVNQSDLKLSYDFKAYDVLPLTVGFSYRHIDIQSSGLAVPLPSHLEGRQLHLGAKLPVPFVDSDVYFMGVDIMPSWYSDDWTWEDSAFRLPFRLYGIYRPSETFVFVLGASVNIDSVDAPVSPIIGFNYRPNEQWDFRLATGEPSITYHLNDRWSLFAEYGFLRDEYEVTRGGQKGVVLLAREMNYGAGIRYRFEKWLDASLSSGMVMGRRFEYADHQGKVVVDDAPYLKARLALKF